MFLPTFKVSSSFFNLIVENILKMFVLLFARLHLIPKLVFCNCTYVYLLGNYTCEIEWQGSPIQLTHPLQVNNFNTTQQVIINELA